MRPDIPLSSLTQTANFAFAMAIVALTLAARRDGRPQNTRSWIFFGLAAFALLAHSSLDLLGVTMSLYSSVAELATSGFLGLGLVFLYGADHQGMRTAQHNADHDGLTGLLNFRAFAATAGERLRAAAAHEGTSAVAIFDVDSFKAINDRLGHPVGDRVLRAVASAIASQLRGHDLACRYGGDEFIVLVDRCDVREAEHIARRVLAATEMLTRSVGAHVSLSAGVAAFPEAGADLGLLIQRADQMLLSAKQAGKKDVRVAESGSSATLREVALVAAAMPLRISRLPDN